MAGMLKTGLAIAAVCLAARTHAQTPRVYREDLRGAPIGGTVLFADGFEKDADRDGAPDKWWRRRGKLTWDERVAHTGRHSVRIDGPGDWGRSCGQGNSRAFDLAQEHYFVVWVRAEGVAPRSVYLAAYYWDSKTKSAAGPRVESASIGPTHGWKKLAVRLPALPGAAASVWAGVSLVSRGQTGRVWFDDLQVVRPDPAAQPPPPTAPRPGVAKAVTFQGQEAVRLENDFARATILPHAGGRIVEYTLKATQTNAFR